MADFIKNPVVELPDRQPEQQIPKEQLSFTEAEKEQLRTYIGQYPTADGAVMHGLWLAQEKFGFLPPEVIRLLADEMGLPYAKVYGVPTFYTQYYKKPVGTFVLDVCTCFSCQVCGGYDMLHYLEEKLGIHKGETTADGLFTIQEAECLGACGSAPMLQVTNGPYVHNLSRAKIDRLLDGMRAGKMPDFTSVTLPQDEDEMGGNRRSDAARAEPYQAPPVAETVR
jgi:NADH-quinone oxidoreductase subunit E